jgi:hypothetical protein
MMLRKTKKYILLKFYEVFLIPVKLLYLTYVLQFAETRTIRKQNYKICIDVFIVMRICARTRFRW